MKKTNFKCSKAIGLALCMLACLLFAGTTCIKADSNEFNNVIRVSGVKELQKAIDDPDVEYIIFATRKFAKMTIKANENAKDKKLYINADNVNITNKAVFNEINIVAVDNYIESVSGNNIALFDPSDFQSFTIAKNKTVEKLYISTFDSFYNTHCKYVVRKGAKINHVFLSYVDPYGATSKISEFNEKKRNGTLKYTDAEGNTRSYVFKLDDSGRITRLVSKSTLKYDYNFTYDENGNNTGVSGYDGDDGNFTATGVFEDNLLKEYTLSSGVEKYEDYYSYDDNNKVTGIKRVNHFKDGDYVQFYGYLYDSKGRIILEFYDNIEGDYKVSYNNSYNAKGYMLKSKAIFYNSDGKQEDDVEEIIYKYNKAGDLVKKTITKGNIKTITKFTLDEFGYVTDEKTTSNEPVEINMSEEEYKELIHTLFTKNQKEQLFKRHKSMLINTHDHFKEDTDLEQNIYITSDSHYLETQEWIEYEKDGLVYEITGLQDPENVTASYLLDLNEDCTSGLWTFMSGDEKDFIDTDHEHLLRAYKENGKIHLFILMDEEYSKKFSEMYLPEGYNGEIWESEIIIDEKNYDFSANILRINLNGKTMIFEESVMQYDVPEPYTCTAVRAIYGGNFINTRTVTCIVDPDSDHEITRSFKVPCNCNLGYTMDYMLDTRSYTDRECTKAASLDDWNQMNDFTIYVKHIEFDDEI